MLLAVATFSFFVSLFSSEPNGWLTGVSIYIAVFFMTLISTVCNYGKENQFKNLLAQIHAEQATVIRGQYGVSSQIPVSDIVVGDILLLQQGDRVPADCLLIQEMDMTVNEKEFFPEQTHFAVKQCATGENHYDNPDMILLQGSLIMSGTGRAVVLAVGERTRREMELTDQKLETGNQVTPTQERLEAFADLLSKYATYAAFAVLLILSVYELLQIILGSKDFISSSTLFTLIENIQITISLLIVCVPEGLPLAVSMSMAFSIDKLIEDNLLIKQLDSLETSGSVLDILTGKTSTLTKGKLKVESIYAGMSLHTSD